MEYDKIRLATGYGVYGDLFGGYTPLQQVDLPFFGVTSSSPYILKAADGLGPPEMDVGLGTTLGQGVKHQGSYPQNREMVLRVGLHPDYAAGQTASDLRSTLYKQIMQNYVDGVEVLFMAGETVLVSTPGRIKRIEIVPFSKDPEVQITIPSVGPLSSYLVSPTTIDASVGIPLDTNNINVLGVESDAPTGFRMSFEFAASDAEGFNFGRLVGPGDFIDVDAVSWMGFNYPVNAGDFFTFNSIPGQREITIGLFSDEVSLTGYLDSFNKEWLMLNPGDNYLFVSVYGEVHSLTYNNTYWGV